MRETDRLMISPATGADRHQHEPHREQDQVRNATAVGIVAATSADPAPPPGAHEELRQQHRGAHQGGHDRAQQDVAVERRGRSRGRSRPRARPGSSCPSRPSVTAIDACSGSRPVASAFGACSGTIVDPRLRHTGGDREALDDVVQPRLFVRASPRLARVEREHDAVAVEVGPDRQRQGHHQRDRPGRAAPCRRGSRCARPTTRQEERRAEDEQHRLALVRRDLFVHLGARARDRRAPARAPDRRYRRTRALVEPGMPWRPGWTGTSRPACSASSPGRCRTVARRRSSTRCPASSSCNARKFWLALRSG